MQTPGLPEPLLSGPALQGLLTGYKSTQTTFSTRITPTGVVLTPQQPIVQAIVQPPLPDISHQDLQDILPANLSEDENMSDYADLQNL